ncbi:MAG: ATP-binding protein [Patescibacteria group bacterium]
MFEFDFRNIIVAVSLIIHAVLLWLLYRYGRKTPGGKAYSVAILAIAGWVLPIVFYRSHLFGEVILWARLLYVMASFTSTSFFLFTCVFPDDKKISLWIQLGLLIENILIALLVFHPTLMIRGVTIVDKGEDIILWGPLYAVYSSHISIFFLLGFVNLFKKMRRSAGAARSQILSILIGYFFAANLAMTTNLILPWFGYFELNWLGQFFSTIVAVFTTYAILKHKLLDIKVIATEGFILILNFFLILQLILSDSYKQFMINIFVVVAVLAVSYLLIRSVHNEVKRREEITKLAQSLEEANIRLREVDKQKTEFISIASHQLRTPLSIFKGYIELIKDGGYGKVDKAVVGVLNKMDINNEHLVKLVDEFLDITRIEQGRAKYEFTMVNICDLIDSAMNDLKIKAEQKKMKIKWACPKRIVNVYCDQEKIHHVIFNFIDNAVKYSDKGIVKVMFDKEDNGVAVRVADQGIGFAKQDEVNFYQKFYRGDNVKVVAVTGTGLGLYVCRKFIEAHNGRVWARSDGLGKGSEFGFWIPFSPKRTPSVHVAPLAP